MSADSKCDIPDKADTPVGKCPICSKPFIKAYRPFCSKRCADVDLGRWLKGDYAIPVMPDDDEDGEDVNISADTIRHDGGGDQH